MGFVQRVQELGDDRKCDKRDSCPCVHPKELRRDTQKQEGVTAPTTETSISLPIVAVAVADCLSATVAEVASRPDVSQHLDADDVGALAAVGVTPRAGGRSKRVTWGKVQTWEFPCPEWRNAAETRVTRSRVLQGPWWIRVAGCSSVHLRSDWPSHSIVACQALRLRSSL